MTRKFSWRASVQDGQEFVVVQADGLLVGQVGFDRSDALLPAAGLQLGQPGSSFQAVTLMCSP